MGPDAGREGEIRESRGSSLRDIVKIRRSLSKPRFKTFLEKANRDPLLAEKLYIFNARLSGALFFPINIFEVTVRNAIDEALVEGFGSRWHLDATFENFLTRPSRDALAQAKMRAERQSGYTGSRDTVISELTFGFWSHLLRVDYHDFWRTRLNVVFPGIPGRRKKRVRLSSKMMEIGELRNRIAHHEPIFEKNALAIHRNLIDVVGYRDATTANWVASNSDMQNVIRTCPDCVRELLDN